MTIISGNIEAWIGISAAHAYLFLEKLYDALLEAGLVTSNSGSRSAPEPELPSSSSSYSTDRRPIGSDSGAHRRGRASDADGSRSSFVISIFTTLKFKVSQLFTYLFHRLLERWFGFGSKTNKRVIGQSRVTESTRRRIRIRRGSKVAVGTGRVGAIFPGEM